jgi:hypothetical protein
VMHVVIVGWSATQVSEEVTTEPDPAAEFADKQRPPEWRLG